MARRSVKHIEAILEAGSISGAARKLFVAQPSLSQYIRRIEDEYAIELFDRSAQPWVLTEDGRFYLDAERRIEAIERERDQYLSDRRDLACGEVTIGSTQYRSLVILPRVLSEFRRRYPAISVKVTEGTTVDVIRYAEEGLVDCSFAIESMVTEELFSEHVAGERVLICMPESHAPVRSSEPVVPRGFRVARFTEFAHDDFIIMKPGQVFHDYFERLCAKHRIRPSIVLETQSITTVPTLIRAGLGVAFVPDTLVEFEHEGLRYYDLGNDLPENRLSIVWSRRRYLSRAARAFISVAKEQAQTQKF